MIKRLLPSGGSFFVAQSAQERIEFPFVTTKGLFVQKILAQSLNLTIFLIHSIHSIIYEAEQGSPVWFSCCKGGFVCLEIIGEYKEEDSVCLRESQGKPGDLL